MGIEGIISDDISRGWLDWYEYMQRMDDRKLFRQTKENFDGGN